MNRATIMIAWVGLSGTALLGCYSSVVIDPRGDVREKIYKNNIESIVMNDGTIREFDSPPSVVDSAIVGVASRQSVTIPLSEVSRIVREGGSEGMDSGKIRFIVTKSGSKFEFNAPPTISENYILTGIAVIPSPPVALADVSQVSVRAFSVEKTLSWALGPPLVVGVLGAFAYVASIAAMVGR